MKRQLQSVVVGAAILLPVSAEAQYGLSRPEIGPDPVVPRVVRSGACASRSRGRERGCVPFVRARSTSRHGVIVRYAGHDFDRGRARSIGRRELRDLLGRDAVRRLREHGRDVGLRGAMRAEWVRWGRMGDALVVTVDGVELALGFDHNRDGRLDELVLVDPWDRRWVS